MPTSSPPSEAAGGVVWRRSDAGVEVVVVHRSGLDDWSLPKGSVEPGESAAEAALREVLEETGLHCQAGEELPATEWQRDDGSMRRARWWLMTVVAVGSPRQGDSVNKIEWLHVDQALAIIGHGRDRSVLRTAMERLPGPRGEILSGRSARVGRACAAVLREGILGTEILMVRYRNFWTLPGGGVAKGEQSAAAAVRELREETGLVGTAVRELFDGCWQVEVEPTSRVVLGTDPELAPDRQALRGVAWFTLAEKQDDHQVARVIRSLAGGISNSELRN